jgi:hypothetical protein
MADSLENQLLRSSMLCGMRPNGTPVYRLQLFFVANRDLESSSRLNDFQRALETGVDQKGFWSNYGEKGSGEYQITELGYERATAAFGVIEPNYQPVRKSKFRCVLTGSVGGVAVRISTVGDTAKVSLDGKPTKSAVEACKRLSARTGQSLSTEGTSAVRVLYDLAIEHRFVISLEA